MSEPGGGDGGFASRIPYDQVGGLRPGVWLCVGVGFSREDIKAKCLERGIGFTGDAITSLPQLALKIAAQADAELVASRVLSGLARQEVLRILLADARIGSKLPELKRLKRQAGFFKKLDTAIQAGRLSFAHAEEGAVYSEWLESRLGPNRVRAEVQLLALAYEAWLEGAGLLDPPMLLSRATTLLNEQGWPELLSKPRAIHLFEAQTEEGRERGFWEAVARQVEVVRVGPLELEARSGVELEARSAVELEARSAVEPRPWSWQLWHTLDDAADELAARLAREEAPDGYRRCAVLIPDTPRARRTLHRALKARGVPLADPRDPTRVRWEEALKWAVLPIQAVARSFERTDVVSYLGAFHRGGLLPQWLAEIHARGIRRGIESYSSGRLAAVSDLLSALEESLGGRRSCSELGQAHLGLLRAKGAAVLEEHAWLLSFFEAFWREFALDMERVGLGARRAPPLYWWERLQARLAETPAPVERFKPEAGVATYRLHQAPLQAPPRLYVLGLPPRWLSGEGVGDYWFSERERESLSGEFPVRSGITMRQERLAALRTWVTGAQDVCWLDAAYDADGRERETIDAALRELAGSLGLPENVVPERPAEMGTHPSRLRSFGALRPLPALAVELPRLPLGPGGAPPEITATALDSYSRCGLQALAYHRWRLRDLKNPDTDLWPEARGNILHAAAKVLLESRVGDGSFGVSSRDALEQAWKLEAPRGLVRTPRTERHVRERMLQVLDAFLEKEREYFTRAPSKIASLDSAYFTLKYDDLSIVGTPDRIDEHPEGLFVLDYKTSSSLPSGSDILEHGYRLQLPFYALAARGSLGKPVIGVQFVELNRKGGRGSGIFFTRYNGKDPGKLTTLTARSKSLLAMEPEEAWARLEESIHAQARGFVSGRFDAHPKKEKECTTCAIADLCGLKRLTERLPREQIVPARAPAPEPVQAPVDAPAVAIEPPPTAPVRAPLELT